jgi:hypothetical protein
MVGYVRAIEGSLLPLRGGSFLCAIRLCGACLMQEGSIRRFEIREARSWCFRVLHKVGYVQRALIEGRNM